MEAGLGDKKFLLKDGRRLSVVAFSLFSAWLISFPYEGQILYVLADRFQLNLRSMILVAMALIIAGLFCCGFFVDTIQKAKRMMLFSTLLCLAGTGVFFFPPALLWTIALPVIAFLAASWMAAWAFYFKSCTPKNERLKTAADVLIYPFILVTPVNMAAVYLSVYLGLVLAAFLLIGALFCTFRLPAHDLGEEASPLANSVVMPGGVARPLAFLCLFIIVITIDSGLIVWGYQSCF